MNEPTMETLARRLDRVGRENRRMIFLIMNRKLSIGPIIVLFLTSLLVACAGGPQISAHHRAGAYIEKSSPIAIVPAKIGNPDDLVLPDAITTELLGMGLNVIERTTLSQMVKEKGLDLTEILNGEEYFKIGILTNIETIVIVNSRMEFGNVKNATLRVVDSKTGSIIVSTSYSQAQPGNTAYLRHHDVIDTAREMAKSIKEIVKLDTP